MARKKKNTVDYFPHLIQEGKAMFIIESKYKNDGYATWFKILERLAKSENHYIDLSSNKELMYLASKCNISEDLLKSIINDLVDLDKFDKDLWEQNIIWSQDFVDNISDLYKRRDSEIPTKELICQHLSIKYKHNGLDVGKSTYSKVKDSIVKETKVEVYNGTDISWINFWDTYNKKVGYKKCIAKWNNGSLSKEKKKLAIDYLPAYKQAEPDNKYRQNPLTYLNSETWNDEIIKEETQQDRDKKIRDKYKDAENAEKSLTEN